MTKLHFKLIQLAQIFIKSVSFHRLIRDWNAFPESLNSSVETADDLVITCKFTSLVRDRDLFLKLQILINNSHQ